MATLSLKVSVGDTRSGSRTMQFDPMTVVYDACRMVREKISEANKEGNGMSVSVSYFQKLIKKETVGQAYFTVCQSVCHILRYVSQCVILYGLLVSVSYFAVCQSMTQFVIFSAAIWLCTIKPTSLYHNMYRVIFGVIMV